MGLEKLTASSAGRLVGPGGTYRKICCLGYSPGHLEQMCRAYGLRDYVDRVVEENPRSRGRRDLMGRDLEVCGPDYLECANLEETALVITCDYYWETYENLEGNPAIPIGGRTVYYFADRETEYDEQYRGRYQDTPLENLILFRSGPHASAYVKGTDFADNARALFDYMLQQGYHKKYKLVWLVKDPEEFGRYQKTENVEFLSFDWSDTEDEGKRDRYYRALCLAKYIFFTDAYGFARNSRRDQVRVQLWHGCGFKTRVNFVRCEKRYEYTTVISELYSRIHQDVYGLRGDQMLVTGYAKQDWLFHPLRGWREMLGIGEAGKYIFWLPTFRSAGAGLENLDQKGPKGQTGLPVVGTYGQLALLDEVLQTLDVMLVIKLHPFQDRNKIGQVGGRNIVVLDNDCLADMDIQVNRLLGHGDALISDYSSAAVDYLLLDRPMGFTLDDVDEYEAGRGFVFDDVTEWMPGMELRTFGDFCDFVTEVAGGGDSFREKRRRLGKIMHRFRDDCSCERIIEQLHI